MSKFLSSSQRPISIKLESSATSTKVASDNMSNNQIVESATEPPTSPREPNVATTPQIPVNEDSSSSSYSQRVSEVAAALTMSNSKQQSTSAEATTTTVDVKVQTLLASKKRVIHRYFDELSQTYMQSHNRDFKDFNVKNSSGPVVLDKMRSTMSKITNYSEFRCIASVNYNSDMYTMSSIVSSVDFDKSYEHFAMAGVTKRIKIFDFQNIIDRPYGVHYPLYEMSHNAKLSCVNWNR